MKKTSKQLLSLFHFILFYFVCLRIFCIENDEWRKDIKINRQKAGTQDRHRHIENMLVLKYTLICKYLNFRRCKTKYFVDFVSQTSLHIIPSLAPSSLPSYLCHCMNLLKHQQQEWIKFIWANNLHSFVACLLSFLLFSSPVSNFNDINSWYMEQKREEWMDGSRRQK
jgi:hypothetical protein